MPTLLRRAVVVSTLALACAAPPLLAQETVRVRGTIERVEGATYIVKTRAGETLKIALTDKPLFVAIVKASMADINVTEQLANDGKVAEDFDKKMFVEKAIAAE